MNGPWFDVFHKKYPNITVKVTQSPNGSANAKTDVGKDASKAADVFEVPNDQLGQMANAGYINPLSPSDTANIKKNYVNCMLVQSQEIDKYIERATLK